MSFSLILSSGLTVLLITGLIFTYERRKRRERRLTDFFLRRRMVRQTSLPATYAGRFGNGRVDLQIASIRTSDGGALNIDWTTWSESYSLNGRVTNQYKVTVGIRGQWVTNSSWRLVSAEVAKPAPFLHDPRRLDTAEVLPDGTCLMTWCVRHPDPDVYDSIIRWIEQNILLVQPPGDFHRFFRALPYTEQYALGWLIEFADAMEEDYHGTKGHPTATLADHAEFIKAGPAETELAGKYLLNTSINLGSLAGDGFQIAELAHVFEKRVTMYELSPPGRHMQYLPRFQLFLDRVNRTAYKRASWERLVQRVLGK